MTLQETRSLGQLARIYVGRHTLINPADFPQTKDAAWIRLMVRLLAAPAAARTAGREAVSSKR